LISEIPFVLERPGIAKCGLIEQVLKLASIVKTAFYFGHEFVGDIKAKATALDSSAQNMTGMLLTFEACSAVLADASGTTKTKRSQSSWPKTRSLFLEPLRNIYRKFFCDSHGIYMTYAIHLVKNILL